MKKDSSDKKVDLFTKLAIAIGVLLVGTSAFYFFVIQPHSTQKQAEEAVNEIEQEAAADRDYTRAKDIEYIQMILELAFEEEWEYPDSLIEAGFITDVALPAYPRPHLDSVCSYSSEYEYEKIDDTSYNLKVCFETDELQDEGFEKGENIINP